MEKKIDDGDVCLGYHQAKNNLYCVHSTRSLVNNIGHDGSGINCGITDKFKVVLEDDIKCELVEEVVLDREIINNIRVKMLDKTADDLLPIYKEKVKIYEYILRIIREEEDLVSYMKKKFKIRDIIIYGEGEIGKSIFNMLVQNNINFIGWVDKNIKSSKNVYRINELDVFKNKEIKIIITPTYYRKEIIEDLIKIGWPLEDCIWIDEVMKEMIENREA